MENLNYHRSAHNDFIDRISLKQSLRQYQIEEFAKSTVAAREEDRFSASYRDIISQIKERRGL